MGTVTDTSAPDYTSTQRIQATPGQAFPTRAVHGGQRECWTDRQRRVSQQLLATAAVPFGTHPDICLRTRLVPLGPHGRCVRCTATHDALHALPSLASSCGRLWRTVAPFVRPARCRAHI